MAGPGWRRWWPFATAGVLLAGALILVLLPYQAATDIPAPSGDAIRVRCGTAFQGIGGDPDEALEIANQDPSVTPELLAAAASEGSDACRRKAVVRFVIAGVLLIGGLLIAILVPLLGARRPAPGPPLQQHPT